MSLYAFELVLPRSMDQQVSDWIETQCWATVEYTPSQGTDEVTVHRFSDFHGDNPAGMHKLYLHLALHGPTGKGCW